MDLPRVISKGRERLRRASPLPSLDSGRAPSRFPLPISHLSTLNFQPHMTYTDVTQESIDKLSRAYSDLRVWPYLMTYAALGEGRLSGFGFARGEGGVAAGGCRRRGRWC